MAHEITASDNVVLHKEKAWHGLGIVLPDAPTPVEAFRLGGFDWKVEQHDGYYMRGKEKHRMGNWRANVRSDNGHFLGAVTEGYTPIQNMELAAFCEALAQDGDVVKLESAGTIRGGAKIWALVKGESFSVRKKDEVTPYICVSNGHDGETSLRCTPTTVRVVCSNTLHMVIPEYNDKNNRSAKTAGATYVARHSKNIMDRVEDAKEALKLYQHSLKKTREMMDAAAIKKMTSEELKKFWMTCYVRDHGGVVEQPSNGHEKKAKERMFDAMLGIERRFDGELKLTGQTAWGAVNSYTGWLQHERAVRIKDVVAAGEQRLSSRLFGENDTKSLATFLMALAS